MTIVVSKSIFLDCSYFNDLETAQFLLYLNTEELLPLMVKITMKINNEKIFAMSQKISNLLKNQSAK